MDRKDFSKAFPDLASGLSDDDVEALISSLRVRALVQGDVLVRQGDVPPGAWLVFDGTLGVTVPVADRNVSLGRVPPGGMVGEISFADGGPATATLTAQGPVTVLELTQDGVDELAATHPAAAAALHRAACEALATHLVRATERLQELRGGVSGHSLAEHEGDGLLEVLGRLFGLGRS